MMEEKAEVFPCTEDVADDAAEDVDVDVDVEVLIPPAAVSACALLGPLGR